MPEAFCGALAAHFKINHRGFNSEVQFIFIELEGSVGVKFKLSNPTKDERANEEI
jgi:hypothetical protein